MALPPAPPRVVVINGPNLNMLGLRQPEIYGAARLEDVEALCRREGDALGLSIECFQSNHEGLLVDRIQACRGAAQGIVINPGAYSHTSIAILDALLASELPAVEVHITNIFRREAFRHHSHVSAVAAGVICGFGIRGYALALQALAAIIAGPEA